jgi:hypothetical protein
MINPPIFPLYLRGKRKNAKDEIPDRACAELVSVFRMTTLCQGPRGRQQVLIPV